MVWIMTVNCGSRLCSCARHVQG